MLRPKKVGTLPVGDGSDEVKQTNEITFAPKSLDTLPIENKDITSDALHTQTEFARYLVEQRKAHYYFSVKGNQPTLLDDITTYFSNDSRLADYEDKVSVGHGRIEIRRIWVTSELSKYVLFPHVAQVYRIEREITDKKSGKTSLATAYGVTSRTKKDADPKTILYKVRGHWSIEVSHYIIDWVFDEDRSTIRTGYGPENMTRLRRFAIGLIKSKVEKGISKKMRQLNKNTRAVLDYLKITKNTRRPCAA
ncbi:ISAs1 family transposase [Methyloprofundus sp.]|uniref:ISAs1 family transposase n=1 Tax=Methyloprofundus sp. TaxID=2020875 RepID=UPI003D13CF29